MARPGHSVSEGQKRVCRSQAGSCYVTNTTRLRVCVGVVHTCVHVIARKNEPWNARVSEMRVRGVQGGGYGGKKRVNETGSNESFLVVCRYGDIVDAERHEKHPSALASSPRFAY